MPMAGRGSRFSRDGAVLPKPLIEIDGKPFFWWAAQSVLRSVPVREMVCVVLDEHIAAFAIDTRIRSYFPEARIVGIAEVTSGAAETAKIGVEALVSHGPIAVNDSDHAFSAAMSGTVSVLGSACDGALLCFRSDDPAYSYVNFDPGGSVSGTVEKKVVSGSAIAGCYLFSGADTFLAAYDAYTATCPYDELFVSGLYNRMIEQGSAIRTIDAEDHVSFGTPAEFARVDKARLRAIAGIQA